MDSYSSFDCRAENPTRYQSVINDPVPLVKADPLSVCLILLLAIIGLSLASGGLVVWAWPEGGR